MNPQILVLLSLLVCCALSSLAQTRFEQDCAALAAAKGNDADRLKRLFQLDWDYRMHESPEYATHIGYPGQNDRWSDVSLDAIARRKREARAPLGVIQSIDRSKLGAEDQLNFDLFKESVENALAGLRFNEEYLIISPLSGVQQDLVRVLDQSPHGSVKDYQDILARLKSVPGVIDQTITLLNKGLEAGITPPAITLRDIPQQVQNQMVQDPDKNAFLKPFQEFPKEMSEADRNRLRADAETALKQKVIPAFGKFHEFLVTKYLPRARQTIAMTDLPNGKEWYAHRVRTSTTTTMTPEQIHQLGLSEVKRIRAEMDKIIAETGFKGGFPEFCKYLRTDPKFYHKDIEGLMRHYRDICKRADPELARLFGKLPRLPYGVKEVPSFIEKSQTTAYYEPGSPRMGRPAWFYANTYALDTRPIWEMEALALHESVPGHHLQIALAQEMDGAPEFRKHGGHTAFVEGWGLYAESLGTEMGFYKDPYMKFGQLTYEIWRAIRLVVDTGMHSMGWSRQKAIDYFISNSSKSEHDITVEVDRYITWPGQALAYKIGELKIKELRAYATRELGTQFDVRQFHDQVIDSGSLPLNLLEQRIKEWVTSTRNKAPAGG